MMSALSRSLRSPRVLIALGMILGIAFCAIFAGWIAPHDPGDQNLLSILTPPAWADGGDPSFPLGTDRLGGCVLSRLIYGARTAMLVALFASIGAMIIGSILAHISGYFGGVVDWVIGRMVDVWMSFPPVILSLILMVGLGIGLSKVILAIVLVDWTRFCRVLRSEVLIVTRHDYVAAARLLGFSHWQTIVREVLPATTPLLITLISLEMAIAVVVEAILSFIGLGVGANTPAWGQMIADARQYVYQSPWNLLLPILAIFLTVTAFNLLGDGLRRTLDGAIVPAIRALSFDLPQGKILGLVGESGAGKSMVGRAIAQLLPAGFAITSGSLQFEGEDLARMAPGARRALLGRAIAFIPQAPMTSLNPVRSIGAQFDEHLARLGERSRGARRDRAVAMLTAARLPRAGELLTRYPHQLSGGMCQRVLIALAFSSNPRLVIADEPTTALDVTMHPPILALIADMQRQHGTAVIFITHDLRLAAQLCDQVTVMYAGRAVESGPARAVLSTPAHPYTRCLQLANPSLRAERRALYVMADQMPSLRQLRHLSGCHFAPRCPLVAQECRRAEPPNMAIAADHHVACLRAEATRTIAATAGDGVAAGAAGRPLLQVEGLQK